MKTALQKQLLKIGNLAANGDKDKLRAAIVTLGNEKQIEHRQTNLAKLRAAKRKLLQTSTQKGREKLTQAIDKATRAIKRGSDWKIYGDKFLLFLETGTPQFTICAKGNSKLPFYAFSALPIITCPGFGECGEWCYSFTAWRYPAAYFRQLQNTWLIIHDRQTLADAFHALPRNVVFRLYVDGDIDSTQTLAFWMDLLRQRPDVKAYGYSKSWPLFLSYAKQNKFPANYKLNLSGGSRYGEQYLQAMQNLDCTRGEFVAFNVETKQKKNPAQYRREVSRAAKNAGHEKVFVCPGKCGECARGKHACGSDKFDGVTVAIGIH